jgi:methionyl-tRNA formyltransferase
MTRSRRNEVLRIVLLGTGGALPLGVFGSLVAQGRRLAAVVVPGDAGAPPRQLRERPPVSELPMVSSYVQPGLVELGWRHGCEVWSVGAWKEPGYRLIETLAPDVVVVACWPGRIPERVLALPRWGFINIHPSLLPAYRGPAPFFWQLRDGLREGGVTLHRMSARLDEGPLLAQAPFTFPAGATGEVLDRLAAAHAGHLLVRLLAEMEAGRVEAVPQEGKATYQGWPTEEDFIIPATWSARRVWNFMRGTAEWNLPYTIRLENQHVLAHKAIAVAPRATLQGRAIVRRGSQTAVQFEPGVLLVETMDDGRWTIDDGAW